MRIAAISRGRLQLSFSPPLYRFSSHASGLGRPARVRAGDAEHLVELTQTRHKDT
jgi:hypothetical protein